MSARRRGFTTMIDIEQFKKTKWSFLKNVKMTWEYDGIANVFRDAGIPLYGFDRGTTKMNHPIATIMLPPSKDVNYGVDLYVPIGDLARARSLVKNEQRLRDAAEREAAEGAAYHEAFNAAAIASKKDNAEARKQRRRNTVNALLRKVLPVSAR